MAAWSRWQYPDAYAATRSASAPGLTPAVRLPLRGQRQHDGQRGCVARWRVDGHGAAKGVLRHGAHLREVGERAAAPDDELQLLPLLLERNANRRRLARIRFGGVPHDADEQVEQRIRIAPHVHRFERRREIEIDATIAQ